MRKLNHRITSEQQLQMAAFREHVFAMATSTTTVRDEAERAIAKIVEPALKEFTIHWFSSPKQVSTELRRRDCAHLELACAISDALQEVATQLNDNLVTKLWDEHCVSLRRRLKWLAWSESDAGLTGAFFECGRDAGELACCYGFGKAGLVEYSTNVQRRLSAIVDFMSSAFAMWVFPGHVFVLGKPTQVVVTDGVVADISWDSAV